ncbi:MAG: YqgE/AlgH family protein [Bacteroidota bacterium]|nr:YqgE/AlgH family protein [Bacteroidota bacterium]
MISASKGILLIANPFLKDPNFRRTVIFICEHIPEGTLGFVLNNQFTKTLNELLPELTDSKFPVYLGGPVQGDTLHFLHQYPDLISGGEEVFEGVYWGGNFESLLIHMKNKDINPAKIRFFIGYSGWAEGQLEYELNKESWITSTATRKLIFNTCTADTWKESLIHLGGNYKMMINFPLDPEMN